MLDEYPAVIDKSIQEVLQASGYKRELIQQGKYKLQVYYRKIGFEKTDLANTIYTEAPSEGEGKTHLMFSYSVD